MNSQKTKKLARIMAWLIIAAMILTSFSYLTVLWGGAESSVVYGAEKSTVVTDSSDENYTESQLNFLGIMMKYIQQNYKDKISADQLVQGAYKGVMESLGDPYSVYYVTEKDRSSFTELANGEFEGIGVKLDTDERGVKVTAVVSGSPAESAGLKTGDVITEVDGTSLKGMTAAQGVAYIRGKSGTKANLTVEREGSALQFSVKREKVKTQSVSGKILDGNVGYIRIASFDSDSHMEFALVKAQLLSEGADSFILDLRDNGGGVISTALSIANQLMPAGPIVHYSAQGKEFGTEVADGEGKLNMPLVVLVNGNTASASEILAGALQDSKTGVLAGTKTFGKGVAQQVIDMKNGGSIKLSEFYFLTPNRHVIDHVGITPDHIVYQTNPEKGTVILDKYQSFAPMAEHRATAAGETGLNVYGAQQRLSMLGYPVDINGVMDTKTVTAVKTFQADHKLYSYGGLDLSTVKAIDSAATEYVYTSVYGVGDYQLSKALELLN